MMYWDEQGKVIHVSKERFPVVDKDEIQGVKCEGILRASIPRANIHI